MVFFFIFSYTVDYIWHQNKRRGERNVDKVFFLGGIAGTLGGVCLIVYQALMYLMHETWMPFSVFYLLERGPDSLWNLVTDNQGLVNALQACPLSAALFAVGLILLFIGSKIKNRFA